MSELDDLLKSLGRGADNALPDEQDESVQPPAVSEVPKEEASDVEIPSELSKLIERVNERNNKTVIGDVTGNTETSLQPVDAGGTLGLNVSEPVKAAREPVRNFEFIYDEKPSLGLRDRLTATIFDFANAGSTPNDIQVKRDEVDKAVAKWEERAAEIYDTATEVDLPEARALGIIPLTGMADDELFSDGKVKVYEYIGEDGEIESVLLPKPDSTSFQRVVDQAGRTIFTELYGLVERDEEGGLDVNLAAEDSEFAQAVPDFDMGTGEGLATDLLVYGVPGVQAFKGGKGAVGAATGIIGKADSVIGKSKLANSARRVASVADDAARYAGGSLAVALTEAALSESGDQGMIVSPEVVQQNFTGLTDEQAQDVAMVMDGFIVNGAFDTALFLGGLAGGFLSKKSEGAFGLVSKDFVKDRARRASLMGVLTQIDPALKDMPQNELVEAMRSLSNVLNANSKTVVQVGETTKAIDVDTTNALLKGAYDYIKVSHKSATRGMSPAQRDAYIQSQSEQMVNRVIGLSQANMDNAGLRSQQGGMLQQMSGAFEEEARRVNPNAVDFNTETAQELVEGRRTNIDEAQAEADVATEQAQRMRAEAGVAVQNDPLISEMISDVDPTRFFNDAEYVQQLTRVYGDDFVKSNRRQWDAVNEAYAAIPNDPVDLPAFKTKLAEVFNNIEGGLEGVGNDAAPVMSALKRVFKDKLVSKTDDLTLADPRDATDTLSTPAQVIDALGDNIGYQDLIQFKREIDGLVKNASNRNVSAALGDLRKHILSAETGGQAAYVAEKGGEAAEFVRAADDLFIDTKSRLTNSFTTSRMTDLANIPSYAGANTRVPQGGDVRGMPDMRTEVVRDVLPQATSDVTGSQMDQLRFALSEDLSKGEVNRPLIDLFVAKQTDQLAKALDGNDAQTITDIDNAFESIITQLKNLEAMELVTELEDAKRRIMSVQDELGSRALAADEIAAMALERKKRAEDSIVGELVSARNPNAARTTPTMVVKRALLGDDAGNFVDGLLQSINELPKTRQAAALQATQAMLLRQVRNVTQANSIITPSMAKDVAIPKLMELTDAERSGMLEAVSKAFPNDEYMQATLNATLGSLTDVSLGQRMRVARSQSQTAANIGIRDSVSTGILFAFGYMNPTAAAARRITAGQIEAMERLSKDEQAKIIATVLASPTEFAELTRQIANGMDPSTLSKAKDLFLQSANRTAQYEIRVDKEEDEDSSFLLDMLNYVPQRVQGFFQ